jgi:uncharacterized protein
VVLPDAPPLRTLLTPRTEYVVKIALLVVAFTACVPPKSAEAPAPKPAANATEQALPTGAVTIDTPQGPLRYDVELAIKERERNKGLMYREHMNEDKGMLFIFEKESMQSFWMKNTKIPLDMLFIAEDGTIAGIVESAEPLTLTSRRVDKPSRYVLELNGGTCRRLGIAPGQRVKFEGVPAELVDARVLAK